ncbi:MAG: M3 family oligoendopeptidase [Erysipelotrichaceae bacterium]|nr:M3 family oligoendopeptidase [Erysipelotrichaceae bacterium]
MERFKDLEYVRPSFEQTEEKVYATLKRFDEAKDYETAKETLLEKQDIANEFRTMASIAHIRHDIDMADPFYDDEVQYLNSTAPKLTVVMKKFNEALASSKFRKEFEEEFGDQLFKLLDADIRTNGSEVIEDRVKEAKLVNEYSKIAASCKTVFRGKECNFYGLLKHMLSTDREERKEALEAWAALYESVSGQLDDVYGRLCAVRRQIAEKLNFDNYIDLAYLSRHRFDYTPKDIERFREAVVSYIVPVASKIHEEQRKRLGVEKLEYYDEQLFFKDGNSTPDKDTAGMVAAANTMYHELSKETGEFFDFMVEHDLFDLETKPNKRLGGYCSGLPKYKAPFIFSNFNKTSADTEVLTHEAGHAFESYIANRNQVLGEYTHSTSEINEIHSMGMEFFTEPWYKLFYPEGEGERYVYEHLADSLANITYLVSVDEFQHRVFEGEQPDAKQLRTVWKDIENKFMPWRSYGDNEFLNNGGFWMQKQHIFMYPFYYVDYALAMICALQFYLKMREDREAAWKDYMKLCSLGGSLGYFDLLKEAGLSNPFREETIKEVADGVSKVLEELKQTL